MAGFIEGVHRDQTTLFPERLEDWISEDHLVRVVDLFVDAAARNRNIGEALLRETARRGKVRGAKFVKLEVDLTNAGGARFYERLGFKKKLEDRLFILEQDGLNYFIAERDTP